MSLACTSCHPRTGPGGPCCCIHACGHPACLPLRPGPADPPAVRWVHGAAEEHLAVTGSPMTLCGRAHQGASTPTEGAALCGGCTTWPGRQPARPRRYTVTPRHGHRPNRAPTGNGTGVRVTVGPAGLPLSPRGSARATTVGTPR